MEVRWSVVDELNEGIEYGVLIPVEVRKENGVTLVSCYPQVASEVRAVLSQTEDAFSPATLQALIEAVRPFAAEYHSAPEPYEEDLYYVYALEAPAMPAMTAEGELRPLTIADFARLPNLTDFEPDYDGRMIGLVLEGAICAVAAENPYAPDGTAEIHVLTAEGYRGRGFATACVSGLTRMLFAEGIEYITYCCQRSNAASVHVAEKAGFTRTAEFYPVLCYLED